MYPACNVYTPYCHEACPADNIIPRYLIKTIFSKKRGFEHKMCVLIFSTILSETFLSRNRNEIYIMVNEYWPTCKVHVILVRLKLEFSRQSF